MKLPVSFPAPHPDETLYSLLCRYHVRSCNQSDDATLHQLFDKKRSLHTTVLSPFPLRFATPWTDSFHGISRESLLLDHTAFPFYRAFYSCSNNSRSSYAADRFFMAMYNNCCTPSKKLRSVQSVPRLSGSILVYRIGRYCLRSTVLKSARFIWNQYGKLISLTGISAITSIPPPMNLAIPNHVTTSSILRWSIKTGKISCRWHWISASCFVSHIMASILECEFGKHCSLICFQFITIGFAPS